MRPAVRIAAIGVGIAAVLATVAVVLLVLSTVPALPESCPDEPCVVFGNLNWPVAFAFAPDGRIFYNERLSGNVRVIENGRVLPTPFFTLRDTGQGPEQGLLGLALDPGFPNPPHVYLYHTVSNSTALENRILRLTADGNRGTDLRIILSGIPAAPTHNGGIIGFGPDGYLYALVGDAQSQANAQSLSVLHGKSLRMDRNGTAPPDNPFIGQSGANPLIFTYGHRNMFGLAFHPVGPIFLTENSDNVDDEVNVLLAGGNYGWPTVVGRRNDPRFIDPVQTYTPTIAPTNAAVFDGPAVPSLHRDLIFGDWNTKSLRHLDLAPPNYNSVISQRVLFVSPQPILDVETRPGGAIWFTTTNAIYRYDPVEPQGVSASGAVSADGPLVREVLAAPEGPEAFVVRTR